MDKAVHDAPCEQYTRMKGMVDLERLYVLEDSDDGRRNQMTLSPAIGLIRVPEPDQSPETSCQILSNLVSLGCILTVICSLKALDLLVSIGMPLSKASLSYQSCIRPRREQTIDSLSYTHISSSLPYILFFAVVDLKCLQ